MKVPHPAQVSRRKADRIWGLRGEVLGSGHRSALLWALADDLSDQVVQFHLRQASRNSGAQSGKHSAVVCRLADIHSSSFPALRALIHAQSREKHGVTVFFSALTLFQMTCTICSHSRMCFSSMARLSW